MRLDAYKMRVQLAIHRMKRPDIVKTGVSLGTVNNAFNENRISEATARKIANAIGVDLSEILKKEA